MSDETKLARGAEYYASVLNWYIFPCHGIVDGRCTCGKSEDPGQRGKHPASSHGQKDATTDGATIAGWWATDPNYNVGVFCKPSGFFVVDIDPRSGGLESFDKFEALLGEGLPATVEAQTGIHSMQGREVRGRHLYFKYSGNENLVGNLKAANLPGIDIKFDGYVLAPPSRHHSGAEYSWKPGHAPWEMQMADAPQYLIDAIIKRNARSSSSRSGGYTSKLDPSALDGIEFDGKSFDFEEFKRRGEKIQEGSRAVTIYEIACSVANKIGVSTELGRQAVESWMARFNHEWVEPPLELTGPGSLDMHVSNAIKFVQENPAKSFAPEVDEWQIEFAKKLSEGTARSGPVQVPAIEAQTSVNKPVVDIANLPSDSDDVDMYTAAGTVGGAVSNAAKLGMSVEQATSLVNMDTPKDVDALTAEEGGKPGCRSLSDTGNGRRIVDAFGTVVRYTPGIGWFNWSGTHWRYDKENLTIKEQTKKISAIISSEAINYSDKDELVRLHKWADQSRSASRITSAVESAKTDPRVRVDVSQWDSNPYLLGVANGVVDLRTGELHKGRPELNITKHSPVAYNPGAYSEKWNKFLDEATGGDKELQDWIQRAAGYTLTGMSHLDYMFLMYGPPGSGKNTAVEAFVKCLGTSDYAWPLDSAVLGADDGRGKASDEYHWAQLVGKRMVWADELPDGERLKENQVKKLTGSSEISARSPGEQPFTFSSQAKLWLTTNHRPMITDDAMWRRIRPIPWVHVPEQPDPGLKEYLFDPEGGLPAVLAWMIEGAQKFINSPQKDGLGWCKAVYEAAEMYRKSEDRIGLFFEEKMEHNPAGSVRLADINPQYRFWSEERGERPMAVGKLQRKLADRGYKIEGNGSSAILYGYTLAKTIPNGGSSLAALVNGVSDFTWS